MFEVIFLFVMGIIWVGFASVSDLKSREVPNWISFSLIVFALGFRFFFSLFSYDFGFFWQGLLGLGIFFILGNLFYYGRLFAGGDVKLMIALGPVLAFSSLFYENLKIFTTFFLLFLFVGAIYGIFSAAFLSIKNFKEFKKGFYKKAKDGRKILVFGMILGLLIFFAGFLDSLLFLFGILVFVLPYLYIYAKAVDEKCMIKDVNVKDLTEGDWLYQDIKIGKRVIKARWDGLNSEEISFIRKKMKNVKIKQGIPFVPVFFVAFLILVYLWKGSLWNAFW
ncbi:MAG: A24 family peptidase [Nanoarchaeota archaeon]